jgi:chromosome segregation protein
MLKTLQLCGFKSFADRTEFHFSPGITGIVGPNGSGKSNIVDAVRWVLGEQSAKSLRGGEMADVIFNGSTSRRSLGLAEVTMIFDNSRHVLATESEEVQITRRVYRSGEGEYLINGQVCRLKDIKQLFLGSGAGADAYCVIEQGRVDVLLQASTRDRRTIFEEAAGISRFKARKIETLRKLERVDQNVQRLKDIIEEVEKQLRSVRLQAAKAERHQEYTNRLRELRLSLGLLEYQQDAERLAAETAVLDNLRAGLQQQSAQVENWERETAQLEETLRRCEEAIHEHESLHSHAREQIAAEETTLGHEWSLTSDLDTELNRMRTRLAELTAWVTALVVSVGSVAAEMGEAEAQVLAQRQLVKSHQDDLHSLVRRLEELQNQVKADKAEHFELMRQVGRLQNDAVSYRAQVEGLSKERDRLRQRNSQAAENLASVDLELQELTSADESLQARLAAARQGLSEQRLERERLRQLGEQTASSAADLRAQRSGLASRIEVLEGLERSREGLGTGVREVLDLVGAADPGPWRTIVGMVADLLTVRREYAPLIDLALGERAQRFVVRDADLLHEALRQHGQPFSSRVSFLFLPSASEGTQAERHEDTETRRHGDTESDSSLLSPRLRVSVSPCLPVSATPRLPSDVLAQAESLVSCDNPDLAGLPAQLLGPVLIVRDLELARALAARTRDHRFVTLQGEVIELDGTLTIGAHHAETGILSRRSELRDLREQVLQIDRRIVETERDLVGLRDDIAVLDAEAETLQVEIDALAEQAADLRSRIGHHRQRREGLHEEVVLSRSEISGIEGEIHELQRAWEQARIAAARAEAEVQALHARIEAADRAQREEEVRREVLQQQFTASKVALAQVEERLTALRTRHRETVADLERRRQEQHLAEQQLSDAEARLQDSQCTMLQASMVLARCYLEKEVAERRLAALGEERGFQRAQRQHLLEQAQSARSAWQVQQEQVHARELQVNDLRNRLNALVQRIRDDYQVELTELYDRATQAGRQAGPAGMETNPSLPSDTPGPTDPAMEARLDVCVSGVQSLDPNQANEEIAELRRKLSRLGSVNLEALQELNELETRAAALQAQYNDLDAAKRELEEIIAKINEDSRRLFTETFAMIQSNFQDLFRKLFGGGMADIILEDEADILESGIEIIARPPGKELRSISLMSGGEKTLTAVALLLAIFRTKPSPFCILDEVDAALDEANIGRFTTVLRDFLDQSHFIIITHSKRTMTVCDVLYGITMQESGISKRVGVRLEDWPDDGQAQPSAAAAEPAVDSFAGR